MRPRNRLFALGVAVVIISGCHRPSHQESKKEAEQRWNQVRAGVKLQLARQQYDGGLFSEVVRTVSESISLDPTRPEAYVLLVKANLELAKPASAEQAIEAARRSGLASADLHYMRGVILEQRNELAAAVEEYAQARKLASGNVDYLVAHAECLVALDQRREALALLDENRNRFDDHGAIAILAGRLAAQMGDAEGAVARLAEASVLMKDRLILAEELGLLYVQLGRCSEAVAELRPLIDTAEEAEAGTVRRGLAACYLTLEDPASAALVLRDYLLHHPEDGPAQLQLARASIQTNDLITAARSLHLAELVAPGRGDIALVKAALLWRRCEYPAAAETLYELLAKETTNVEAYCLLAEVLRAQNQHDAARDLLVQAIKINPTCTWARDALVSMVGMDEAIAISSRLNP